MKIEETLKKLDRKYYWIIAFLLPVVSMTLAFYFLGLLGGDYMVLRSDLLAGTIPCFKDLARSVLSGESIYFAYNSGMGVNTALTAACNAFSPFNIFYLILFNVDENITTFIIILLKVGCIGASFQFFSRKVLKYDGFFSVIISSFFAMSAFVVAYGTIHIMWLDSIILLPLLIYAIIRCIDEQKRALLIILYTELFVIQFYMAYMVGMFTLLFVICYLLFMYNYKNGEKKVKQFFRAFFDWALCGVIAVMLSAVVWAPTLFFILANRAEDSSAIIDIQTSLLQIVNSLFWGQGYGIEGLYGYIYCGIPALILFPFYFCNKESKTKEKLFAGIIFGFMMLCMITTPLNKFMHAFDQPDSFWYRYSYLISFCLCVIACRQLAHLSNVKGKLMTSVVVAFALFYLFEQQLVPLLNLETAYNPSTNNNKGFIINMLFAILWSLIIIFYHKSEAKRTLLCVLASLLVIIETSTSSISEIPLIDSVEGYYEWYSVLKDASDHIRANDKGLYRTVSTSSMAHNADTWFGYFGLSDFGDGEKYPVRKFMSNIGFATSTRLVLETGYTPVSNMILGIKYTIMPPNPLFDFLDNKNLNEHSYLVNEEALGMGYLVSGDIVFYEFPGKNAFENMNGLVNAMTGEERNCFEPVDEEYIKYDAFGCTYYTERGDEKQLLTLDDMEANFYITVKDPNHDEYYLQIETDNPGYYLYDFYVMGVENSGTRQFVSASFGNANKFFYNEEKDKYNLFLHGEQNSSPASFEFNSLNIYGVNRENLEAQREELAKQQLNITEWSNGHIKGTVNVTSGKRLMFVSIPYDAGWTVKVDGKEVEVVRLIDGTFIGFFLPSDGEHLVEMDYEVPGMKVGLAVSLCGILAFLSVVFEKQLKGNKNKKKEDNMSPNENGENKEDENQEENAMTDEIIETESIKKEEKE